MNPRKILMIAMFSMICSILFSQEYIQYSYDQNGNRCSRTLTVESLKSGSVDSPKDSLKIQDDLLDGIKVYPNPVTSNLKIVITGFSEENAIYAIITNMDGKTLIKEKLPAIENTIDVSFLNDGIYILNISIGTKTLVYKIIKAN